MGVGGLGFRVWCARVGLGDLGIHFFLQGVGFMYIVRIKGPLKHNKANEVRLQQRATKFCHLTKEKAKQAKDLRLQ